MKTKLFLTLFLIFTVVVAGMTLLSKGSIIGQKFEDSGVLVGEKDSFLNDLEYYVLDPIDFEEAKESITVTEAEIHYYREYYGSLSSQLENVRLQYEDLLADEGLAAEDRAIYEKERDAKLREIRENFESNEVVEEKIRAIKERGLAELEKVYNEGKRKFEKRYSHFGYKLMDQFGNTYESAVKGETLERLTYTEGAPWHVDVDNYISLHEYVSGEPGIEQWDIHIPTKNLYFVGEVVLSESVLQQEYIKEEQRIYTIQSWLLYLMVGAGLVAAILLATVMKPNRDVFAGWPQMEERFVKLPLDIQLAVPVLCAFFSLFILESIPHNIFSMAYRLGSGSGIGIGLFVEETIIYGIGFLFMSTLILTGIWVFDAIRKEGLHEGNSLIMRLGGAVKESFLDKSIGKQTMAMFVVFFLAGIGFLVCLMMPVAILLYIPLVLFILLPTMYIYFKRMGYLNRVMKQTEEMAAGRLTSPIEVKGKSPIARHAGNLNDLRKGIESSMKEQAKSERLKTELITNVSHDLRTPLTSIITYTDLLKNPDLTEEERAKYVGILDQKSAKLKTLIEDLFDVSKMASGNVEIDRRRVDLAQMLQQAAGEHEEDFAAAGLDLRVAIHDQPVYAEVDGQKWWRVVDNLLLNARKYSLEGTRVYVSLRTVSGMAEFSVKNVAKYELGENVEELTERFKRADTSRHTEGSGLGLAIAQSIVDLHGAQLKIEVDGDLFKVIVKIHTV